MNITRESFGRTEDGRAVTRYTMTNGAGMTVRVLDYGCTVQSVIVPDRTGSPVDVVLGYDDIDGYEQGSCWFGAFVGRYANRIKGAAFTLGGKTFSLPKNDGENHLHGTFDRRVFEAFPGDGALALRYESPDGEEGFPGTLHVTVTYSLTEDNALVMDYRAAADVDTVVNLTNHSYFNLSGAGSGDVLGQHLRLRSSRVTEVGEGTLPTGRILSVEGTALDFRAGKPIGRDIAADEPSLRLCSGYDHNYILDKEPGLSLCGEAYSPETGIAMAFSTTQPAVQLYTGQFVAGDAAPCGKNGVRYPKYGGFCLESQHYPCSPNYPEFPSTLLRPGEEYREITAYRFSVR